MRRLGRKLRRLRSLSRKEKTTQAGEVCVVFVVKTLHQSPVVGFVGQCH